MKKMKQLLVLLLAAAMVLGLAACGQTNVEETPAPEFVYKATFQKLENNTENGNNYYPTMVTEDGFYCFNNEVVGQRELREGETLEYDGQLDVYESRLYRLGVDGKYQKMEQYQPMKLEAEESHDISGGPNSMIALPQGGFLVLESSYESWNDAGDDVEMYSDEWYMTMKYEENSYLRVLDENGKELSCVKLDCEQLKQSSGQDYIYFNGLAAVGDHEALMASDGGLYIFDTQTGKMTGQVKGIDWPQKILTLHDGRVAVAYYGEDGQKLSIVDTENRKLGDSYPIQGDFYQAIAGGGEYDIYFTNGVNFYGYKLESGTAEKLFNWINCDVDNDTINGFTVTADGKIVAVSTEWDAKNQQSTASLITMDKVSSDTLPKKETITFACQYLDWNARRAIINFNRSHENVRIEVLDYSEYNTEDDYDAGLTKLRTEILAGNCPDIINLSQMPARQLAAKGLLADLYPLLDADPELKREDFFPEVLKAMENDGKLFSTCSSFTVLTAVGPSKIVGTEPGWTYDQLAAALAQMPEGCTVFSQSETRYDVLQYCLMMDMEHYVDWNTGRVSFDTPEFISLLNFVKDFPAEFDWEHYEWSEDDDDNARVREGKQLLIYASLYGFDDISQYENIFGGLDAFTFIGFPTSSGVGSLLMPEVGYAISAKCQNKETAWEFVRTFMTEDYQKENSYNFPSNIHVYNEKKTNAMTETFMKDDDGRVMLDSETGEKLRESKGGYWDNEKSEWVDIYSYTKEEIEKLESAISSADRIYEPDEAINDIVKEQIEAFFAGQRSAEDVAKLIQSKAMIYVNEQK